MSLLDDWIRTEEPEILDSPETPLPLRRQMMRELDRLSRVFGLYERTVRGVLPLVEEAARRAPGRAVRLLDIGCGEGGVLDRIAAAARARLVPVTPIGVDLVRQYAGSGARLARGDARRLPLRDGGADVVVNTLALHHLAPEDAVDLLREADRVAAHALYVFDLRRDWRLLAPYWVATRAVVGRHTHHDGMLSLRRAYTVDEVRDLATLAGLHGRLHVRARAPVFLTAIRR